MISGKHAFWKTYHIDAKKLPKREGLKALPGRGTGIRKGNIAKIQEMAAGGSSAAKIADALGISKADAYKYMPKETVEEEFALPKVLRLAEERKPHLPKVMVKGKCYIDVTDLYIPY